MFRIIIPLTTGSMIKAGGRSTSEEGELQHSAFIMDIGLEKLVEILEFCNEPRTRAELQEFCGYKSSSHFREKILAPLLAGKQLVLTILNKPNSPKQKYVRRTSPRA